ncbi:MAG: sugar phosphate isomerase/epimerase [Candidatus Hydrogenedentes bacterium]|nr:sugar phosphate isomerase/epimerase [Candidatus Hydrogenedentota bacterium]
MPAALTDFSRMCVHTMTTKPLKLDEAIAAYTKEGIPGITVWRQHVEAVGAEEAGKMLRDSGLKVVSLCRGGFFPATSGTAREEARTENRRVIDEAAEIGAPLVVLVCGAHPEIDQQTARQQITDGIHSIIPHAKAAGVKLGIEVLHPMYAADRSAVCTMDQANNMILALGSEWTGLVVDVYHVWWDHFLRAEIQRARDTILGFHVCDWRVPTRDLLNDRGVMGDGCIKIREIRGWMEELGGFKGFIEVEIFSEECWGLDQTRYLKRLKNAYLKHV